MITTLLGTLAGGLFRFLPELLKFFDRRCDRQHELDMFNLQLEADKLKGQLALDKINAEVGGKLGIAEIQAIIEATKAQGARTGIKWVDAISSLIRPAITFWWVIVMYTGALIAQYMAAISLNADITNFDALLQIWGPDEKAIAASIISFWFVDRSIRKDKI